MRRIYKKYERSPCWATFTRLKGRITSHVCAARQGEGHSFADLPWWRVGQLVLAIGLMGICLSALADGNDILQGTDASLWATLNGTGKKYIYAAEGILGLAAYMKTKNLLVLSGIVVVSIFFNIILSIAGESA